MKYSVSRKPLEVKTGKRQDGTAWISVGDPSSGPHFQCDYLRDPDVSPASVIDFAEPPPSWVVTALGLSSGTLL
jgi:hypothetical protein